ncbi:MAG TPA: PDZ domain-containing protein [Candidatus Rubrimentiphilum sp.]|nr:PDZ domain-containing protein [Candidatus Rubrimentiphilum sp.]
MAAAFTLSFPVVQLLLESGNLMGINPAPIGAVVDYPTGIVRAVGPGTPAARAGLRPDDRIDYARAGWTMRIWIRSGHLRAGIPTPLPIVRAGRPVTITLLAPRVPPISAGQLVLDSAEILATLVYIVLGCAFYFASRTKLSLAFMIFCFAMTGPFANTSWLHAVPRWAEPLAALAGAVLPLFQTWAYLTLCLRFPTGEAVGRWRLVDRALPAIIVVCFVMYYGHFYTVAFVNGENDPLYNGFVSFVWFTYFLGAAAFLARYWGTRGAETIRMRWVAVALAVYLGILATFFIGQVLRSNALWISYLTLFNPAPFAFAYALVRGRIIDVRIFGGRAIVYGALTAIPVALLAIVDWFFARRLQDARLATFLEVAVAVGFSFWLRSLHRRIERFVERVFFASRHRALERVRHITRALPFSERIETIETLLADEIAAALQLASAAVFRAEEGAFVLTAARDWEAGAERLDPDDPLILFARSSHGGIHLDDVPRTRVAVPQGDARPAFGLPVTVGRRVIAVVLYGNHLNGEPIDGEEEDLLNAAAHASATAYEHLHALEREREIAQLRSQLQLSTSS